MAGLFSVGISGLNVAQLGILTTQHNITNVNTEGFSRQENIQSTNIPQSSGSGFIGRGSNVETVRRVYNEYLNDQILNVSAQAGYYDTFLSQVSQIDNLLSDTNAGLSPALQEFFTATNGVAANPTSIASRQAVLSSGQTLVSRLESLYGRLDDLRTGVNTQLQAYVNDVNGYSLRIAELNERISEAQNLSDQPPNDLLDARDLAIAKLNEIAKVTVAKENDGNYNIYIGNGQSLVTGFTANTLALNRDQFDPSQLNIAYVFGNNTVDIPQLSLESGGALGGLLAFRRTTLNEAQNALGRVALGLAQTFNEQHQLGQDLNGALGQEFFNIDVTSPTVYAPTSNTGTLLFTATAIDAGSLTTSNYFVDFNGVDFTLTDTTTGATTTGLNNAGLLTALSNVGITFTTAGAPNAGDRFLILPTRFGARDISVALTDPSTIAAANATITTTARATNTGNATISSATFSTANPPLDPNLLAPVTITFNNPATDFDVSGTGTGNPTAVAYTSGGNITFNGWTIQITGTPNPGDVFTIAGNPNVVGDNRNAVALAALQNTRTLANNSLGAPTTTYQGAYAQLVSEIGSDTQRTRNNNATQQTLLSNVTQTQQSISGVNLDEEAANLLRYQQAYQAAARIIQTSSSLFDTILQIR